MQWYYITDDKQSGPVTEADIRRLLAEGVLQWSSLVWNETMGSEWRAVSDVPGLSAEPAERAEPAETADAVEPGQTARTSGGLLRSERPRSFGTPHAYTVSCTAPIGTAWERMKAVLFRPFDMKKWFVLGFTAFLTNLQQGGSFNFRAGGGDFKNMPDFSEVSGQVKGFLQEHAAEMMAVVAIVVVVLLAGLAIGLLLLWVSSRGRFMFLDNVVNNRAEVKYPWAVFAQHGNSLFVWRILFGLACLVLFVAVGGLAVLAIFMPMSRMAPGATPPIAGIVICSVLGIILALCVGMIMFFLDQFVVPIMYISDLTAREAWSKFLALFRTNTGSFILYALMYMLLSILAGIVALIVIIPLCCVLSCLLLIPFLGAYLLAVAFLPMSVFFRQYSLDYLAQFGPEYEAQAKAI